jgi:hypothetical protein
LDRFGSAGAQGLSTPPPRALARHDERFRVQSLAEGAKPPQNLFRILGNLQGAAPLVPIELAETQHVDGDLTQ